MSNRSSSAKLLPRHTESRVREALEDTRVVVITGPRQAGKSTLAGLALAGDPRAKQVTLDDEVTLNAAKADPRGFLMHEGTMLIDEIQRAPELFLAIKMAVDRDRRPGQFLLTGSAHALGVPNLANALVGRMELVELWPFSQGEIEGRKERFIDRLRAGDFERSSSELNRADYLKRAAAGGFPEVVMRPSARARTRWFGSYIETLAGREISDIMDIERPAALRNLLALAAARTGSPMNVQDLARDADLPGTTVRRYLALLELTCALQRLPGWATSRTTRLTKAPKLLLTDPGLASYLLDLTAESFDIPGRDPGPILETFVIMELKRQLSWSDMRADLRYFRTKEGVEVDAVLEYPDGKIAGVEVKASSTVRKDDFRGLRMLASKAADRFATGVVLYTGSDALSFGPNQWALPISDLWK